MPAVLSASRSGVVIQRSGRCEGGARVTSGGCQTRERGSRRAGLTAAASMDVTLVAVSVIDGAGAKFEEASVSNASNSLKEQDNLRFDALRNVDDPSSYVLVEVYGSEEGPLDHKKSKHYNDWRENVADIMAEPRVGTKYRAVWPTSAADWKAEPGSLRGEDVQITHVHIDCLPDRIDAFKDRCIDNASNSMKEPENIRFDCLQSIEDPCKFVMIEIYRTSQGPIDHKKTKHYNEWRENCDPMMATPRFKRNYVSL